MKTRNGSIMLLIAVAALLVISVNVAAVSDGTNDVWHQTWSSTGWSWEAYTGTRDNIDITDISYSFSDSVATVTMKTIGPMSTGMENEVVYTINLKSDDQSYYMVTYASGQGTVMGFGDFMGMVEQLKEPITGNTFTATFNISNPNANYKINGFNVEYADLGNEQGESWWDYAPNEDAPYYTGGDDGGDDDGTNGDDGTGGDDSGNGGKPKPETPGFEILTLITALSITFILLRRRK